MADIVRITRSNKPIWPLIKVVARNLKKHGWSDRTGPAKFGIASIGISLVLGGFQGAGIAALGSAIGVPLWVVFGAGGTFAATIITEINRTLANRAAGDAENPHTSSSDEETFEVNFTRMD